MNFLIMMCLFLFWKKSVYPYEYMDDRQKFNETSIPEKEHFQSQLNIDDITDADFRHTKNFCKDFKITNVGGYRDLKFKAIHYYYCQLMYLVTFEIRVLK